MRYYLILLLLEGLFSFTTQYLFDREILAIIYIIINVLFFIVYFYQTSDNKELFMILVGGLLLRLLALMYDQTIATLPFNTMDANAFHYNGIQTANALPNRLLEHYTGFYSQFLGIVYYIFGPYRFFGHFINISFIIFAATKLIDIAYLMNIRIKNIKLLIFLWLFMPIPFLMGFALLREASIYYFIVLSIYYFLKWIKELRLIDIVLAVTAVFLSSLYHDGMIVLSLAYLYAFIFYNRKYKKIGVRVSNVLAIILVLIIGMQFLNNEKGQEFINKTNAETGGGSTYLEELKVESPIEFIIASPIKATYLIYSPMPWLIRGGLDILTFLLDSCLWIYATYLILRYYKQLKTEHRIMLLGIVICGVVFGMGTHNTGTAIRHRNKFMPLILITYIYVKNYVIDNLKESTHA